MKTLFAILCVFSASTGWSQHRGAATASAAFHYQESPGTEEQELIKEIQGLRARIAANSRAKIKEGVGTVVGGMMTVGGPSTATLRTAQGFYRLVTQGRIPGFSIKKIAGKTILYAGTTAVGYFIFETSATSGMALMFQESLLMGALKAKERELRAAASAKMVINE